MVPFSTTWDNEQTQRMRSKCSLDEKALEHIRELQLLIKDRGKISHRIARTLIFLINTQMPNCRRLVERISTTLGPSRSYGSRNCMWMVNSDAYLNVMRAASRILGMPAKPSICGAGTLNLRQLLRVSRVKRHLTSFIYYDRYGLLDLRIRMYGSSTRCNVHPTFYTYHGLYGSHAFRISYSPFSQYYP